MSEEFLYSQIAHEAAQERQKTLTKPLGSLGVLEQLAIQMAGFQGQESPRARPCSAVIFAADHPVTKHGVSPYPSEVTRAMLANFEAGGAAASVLSRTLRIPLLVEDVGVFGAQGSELPGGDVRREDAMSETVFSECVRRGEDLVRNRCRSDRVVIFGEMGIGNTTPSAALCAWLLRAHPEELVGKGTGLSGDGLSRKRQVVREIVNRIEEETNPLNALRKAGGRELAALFGAIRQALRQRTVVLVDGFIVTTVAALLIAKHPEAKEGMVFAHRSNERGHRAVLEYLGVTPLLDLALRLGEASGALVAYPLVESACALHNEMATFESANVPEAVE